MAAPRITLQASPDGALDLVCRQCGGHSRLHPDESLVAQIRLMLDQHRHDPPGKDLPANLL